MIYELDRGGFVISARRMWLPGVYATGQAARWALQFDDELLTDLNERINLTQHRPITTEDLRAARRKTPEPAGQNAV